MVILDGMFVRYCRTDTLGGPKGRRADMAGAPYYMHKNDLRGMAPQWLKYTYIVRGDPQVQSKTPAARPLQEPLL